ncbi:MAG: hypothetical protein IKE01_06645 [Clostridia bacterium]|nr:hypothetical protein [Clostridia bacterium]
MNETQIGKLVINLQIKTDALEKGLSTAKKKIQELESQNKELENSNKGLDLSFVALAASIIGSMSKVKGIIHDSIKEYNEYTQSMSSLSDVAAHTNTNMDELSEIVQDYSKYMNKADIAATIKNFSLMGMTTKQTRQMMESLTNSAIKNRNANYTVSQAVKVASDGYKQGLSTLSDSAGVTENLSVMLDKYAESIGKTASQLTQEEINQAYVNRTMEAAAPFAQAMSEYDETLAAKQGELNNALKETQVAYATAIEPAYSAMLKWITDITSSLGKFVSEHQELAAGSTTFIVTLGALAIAVTVVKKAYDAYTKSTFAATAAQKGFNAAIMANPLGLAVGVIATAVAGIAALGAAYETNKAKQEELTRAQMEYNKVVNGTIEYNDKTIASMKEAKGTIETYIKAYDEWRDAVNSNENFRGNMDILKEIGYTEEQLQQVLEKDANEIQALKNEANALSGDVSKILGMENLELKAHGTEINKVKDAYKAYCKRLEEAEAIQKISAGLDTKAVQNKQKEAAQQKINVKTMQDYLNTVKQGNTATAEYQEAVKKLAEAYPEAATASGILTDVAQQNIDAAGMQADSAWAAAQTEINSYISIIQAALNSEAVQKQVAENVGISVDALVPKLQNVLNLYQSMANMAPTDVPNITPTSVSSKKSSGGGSYQNKALDNYKKQIEHKKALDQLSLNDEIAMYETALKKYAKKADEKNEIREKIYELNKELAKKEKEILEQQTEDYENYMEEQKSMRGAAYNVQEQTEDYDKIIRMHKSYLDQIMKDERLSLDERKEIYRDELQTIRDYEKEKRELRVSSVDNTVSQLTSAITKQLEELHEKDKELIDKNIEDVERWKKARIDAINEEYDARIEAIERELEALDQAEKQKTRDEEDAEYERKKNRLQQLIDYEHDATTKANYQKELDKLVTEHQKTLNARALNDKKDALSKEKELLKDEQDQLVQSVEKSADEQIDAYNNKLEELDKYYEHQISMAQENAEKMLLNVEQNQDKILNLLRNYGDKYEITGQSLGEKLAQGINEGLSDKIQNVIQRVQNTIDSNLESKISEWSSSGYNYVANANKPNANGVNVIQNNYIQQTPEMPSETYRKLRNIDEELASSLARL